MIEFAFPAGLWLGAAGAGVLLAHLVRRRARRRVVPFLPLWAIVAASRRGGFGARLTRALDLLLVLLACGLVAGAAGMPFVPGTPDRQRDLVLVLDGGLSLQGGERADRLRRIAEAEIRRRAEGTRFVLVAVGDRGPRAWRGSDRDEALAFVRAHRPGWTEVGREEAVALARAADRGLRDPDFVLCTHRRGREAGFRLRTHAESVPNAGIADLELVGDPEGGGRVAQLTLRGQGEVELVGAWKGEVEGRRTVSVPLPASGRVVLRVRCAEDRFAADDEAFLLLPERTAPRLLVVAESEPSPFLSAALEALESTGDVQGPLRRTTPAHAAEAASDYDLLIFDRCVPAASPPGLRALYLAPPAGTASFRVGEPQDAPALFDLRREHPLLQGVDLGRVAPIRVRAIFGGESLALAAPGPAVAASPGWVALGFDPDRCVLAASPAYPLLLRNGIAWLAGERTPERPEFVAVGSPTSLHGVAEIEGKGARRVRERLLGPPGFWTLDGIVLPVCLLEPDLDLAPAGEPSDPLAPVGEPGIPDRPLALPCAAAALGLLLVAWWLFWRA